MILMTQEHSPEDIIQWLDKIIQIVLKIREQGSVIININEKQYSPQI